MGSLPYRRLGMKPKKEHEVTSLVSLVQDIWPDKPHRPTHAMDLGSGRAHLSRALAYLPLQMHVTAVDSSESQISGAEKLDTLYQKQHPDFKPLLEHRTKAFNSAEDVSSFLSQWQNDPRSSDIQNKDAARRAPVPLVVALHACGDFSVSILQAFAESMPHLSLILVGCCYNLVSPSSSSDYDTR